MRSSRVLVPWVLLVAVAAAARGDVVVMTNGETFKDVVVEMLETRLRIHLDIGQLDVPLEQIADVRRTQTSLESFMHRRDQLQAKELSLASEWLELALWAQARRLTTPAREALLIAAELDPFLEGLDHLMKRHGYVWDVDRESWNHRPKKIPIPRQPVEPRTQEATRPGDSAVAMAALELAGKAIDAHKDARQPEKVSDRRSPQVLAYYVGRSPVARRSPPRPAPVETGWQEMINRQPGSLIPLTDKSSPSD